MKHYNHPFRTNYTPVAPERKLAPLFDVAGIVAGCIFILWVTLFVGASLDDTPNKELLAAQASEKAAFKRDLAAAEICRKQTPGSVIRWTVDGQLVCVPPFQANRF